jgi:hypothetical protein
MTDLTKRRYRASEALARFAQIHGVDPADLPKEATLATKRSRGGGPPFCKPNNKNVVYEWGPFEEWLLKQMTPRHSTAADAVARRQSARAEG